ncbi:MAG: uroporphyrinogen decarboxylase family protein [Armatimonadota bacterium]
MNDRQRTLAVLNYQDYDRLPQVHFGFWPETLAKWAEEGHLTKDEADTWCDGNESDKSISAKLGFDFNYYTVVGNNADIIPLFDREIIEEMPDGARKVLDPYGVVVLEKDGAGSIPMEIDHLLKGRKEWDEHFLPRLGFSADRLTITDKVVAFLDDENRAEICGLHCGSLFGMIRNWLGVEGTAYLQVDDPELFDEIIDTVGNLSYKCVEAALEKTSAFDFAHYWEDICFKSGPLISPRVFDEKVGPHYKRISDLLNSHGIHIISLDCDGLIDALIPTWFANGVNTMFPIEVGTWNASIAPWREKYGRELRGVGGMDKKVFAYDYAAIDAEIERLKPLVALGGYIPCPDHRIAPDATWENVQYYCEKMRKAFG